MADDIVERLRSAARVCHHGFPNGAGDSFPDPTSCGGCTRLSDAADEIERLRAQVESAHNILGSETMVWVFHGSEGWLQTNLQHLREPIHLYWETYGNALKEAHRG